MIAEQLQTHDVVTHDDLKELAGARGPCISITQNIPNPLELNARLKNMMRTLRNDADVQVAGSAELLKPLEDLVTGLETDRGWAKTLLIFRSPDVFQYYWLRTEWKDTIKVGQRFQARPLFELAAGRQRFHLLVLTQKDVRLLTVTRHHAEELDLRRLTPINFTEFLNTRQPDHKLANRSTGGPSIGDMKGAPFGTSTDRERETESLRHFFSSVDRGVRELLRGSTAPLMLAGVDRDVAFYQQVNTYPRTMPESISGTGFPDNELIERAWASARQSKSGPLGKALADFERHSNHKEVTSDPRIAVKAAFEGRVADLFFTPEARLTGTWDPTTQFVRTGEGEDLVNAAALETVRRSGRAFQLPAEEMPAEAEVLAALRF
jgi:Bacterial archaeo-eukaryotic release factor family 3